MIETNAYALCNPLHLDIYRCFDNTGFDIGFCNGCNYFPYWSWLNPMLISYVNPSLYLDLIVRESSASLTLDTLALWNLNGNGLNYFDSADY